MLAGTTQTSTLSLSTLVGAGGVFWCVLVRIIYQPSLTPIVQFLANFCVVLALVSGKMLQKIFFGQLQPREVEVRFLGISGGVTAEAFP